MAEDEARVRRLLALFAAKAGEDAEQWEWFVQGLSGPVRRAIAEQWGWQAHGGQIEPEGQWRNWMLMAGRGFGKTRAGAEWVWAQARANPDARIALVGATREEAVKVMVEGRSGLIAVARTGETVKWVPTRKVLRFPSGAEAFVYSAGAGEGLRGPEHHFAWADELAKWRNPSAAWDNLQMGLRLGEWPRAIVTTTPRSVPLLKALLDDPDTAVTGGRTDENLHLSGAVRDWLERTYGGTRTGRQELEGVLVEDAEGSLWPRALLAAARAPAGFVAAEGFWKRVVVGVDPPATATGDACGIIVCAMGADEKLYVVADRTVKGKRPEGWANAVARAARDWEASLVVAEKNQGGDMVESVLRQADAWLPVRLVSATRGKAARAEPVAMAFETGRARLLGRFGALEDELAAMTSGGFEGEGSPDRADAMVWAMTELLRGAREPRIWVAGLSPP